MDCFSTYTHISCEMYDQLSFCDAMALKAESMLLVHGTEEINIYAYSQSRIQQMQLLKMSAFMY